MEFLEWHSIWALVSAMYISFFIALALFAGYTFHHLRHVKWNTEKSTWQEMFRLGKFAQGGNVLHILNQRLNVVFLENLAMAGRAQAGIFSIALYGAEAIWTVAKSLSVEQYSRISNSQNPSEHHDITGKYLKISMLIALAAAVGILLLPQSFYTLIFQKEIDGLKNVLVALIPGIMANSASIIFAHYFSGTGMHKHNFIASALGLTLGVITAFLFIPTYGATAAAASASVAFGIQAIYFALVYIRTKRITLTSVSVEN
jgi:O-antigen/teichoic acid export membrane protein